MAEAELRAYNPTLGERIKYSLADLLRGLGMDNYNANLVGGKLQGLAELAPISGNIIAGSELGADKSAWLNALNAVGAAVPGAKVATRTVAGWTPGIERDIAQALAKEYPGSTFGKTYPTLDKINQLHAEKMAKAKPDPFAQVEYPGLPAHLGGISEDDITQKLIADPGASIFDVAGIHPTPAQDAKMAEHGAGVHEAYDLLGPPNNPETYTGFLRPIDWMKETSFHPPENVANMAEHYMGPIAQPQNTIGDPTALGFNLNLPLFKGGSIERPRQIPSGMEKDYEKAFFLADDPWVASKYGNGINQYFARPTNPAAIDWQAATGLTHYDSPLHPMIEAARNAGHDMLVVNNMRDVGGAQKQYLVLDPSIVRAPDAKFDPNKVGLNDILAGLGGATVVGGAVAGSGGEAKAEEQKSVSMATPFGTNIKVPVQSSVPKGVVPQAAAVFDPILSQLKAQGVPVNVTSGYRDPSHNAAVGGASGSQHLGGKALDLSLAGLSDEQKRATIAAFQGNPGIGGFGYYPKSDSIHVDIRPGKAAWGSDYHRTSIGQGWPDWITQATNNWLGQPGAVARAPGASPVAAPAPANLGTQLNLQASLGSAPKPAAAGPSVAATPTQVPLVAPGGPSFPPVQGQGKQPDLFGGLAKALGALAGGSTQPTPLTPAPMLPDPLLLSPGATPPTVAPQLLSLFGSSDPKMLDRALDPRGLFLGLA